jgi:hypothetical protein
MKNKIKRSLPLVLLVAAAAVLAACGGADPLPTSTESGESAAGRESRPVLWSQPFVDYLITPGQSKSLTLRITAPRGLPESTLRAVPEISPFLSISPNTIGPLGPGQSAEILLVVSAPGDALPVTTTGTIQVRPTGGTSATQPLPLPVSIRVDLEKYVDTESGIAVPVAALGGSARVLTTSQSYSDGLQRTELLTEVQLPSGDWASLYAVVVDSNYSGSTDIEQWFSRFVSSGNGLLAGGAYVRRDTASGVQLLVQTGTVPDDYEGGMLNPIYAISADRRFVVTILVSSERAAMDALGMEHASLDALLQYVAVSVEVRQ